ncbi:MAG TPA: dephospho-CoA kinase [Spirochaetales bacterium]|nr:dephospho-CoA kinase [Spirochaetales bacterium]HPG86749.1 dephospho-CoA kinase [Spirochaetales bacterium]HPM71786.1 dephospho-CoA kinase [Spirochaetales bacterium]
MILGLTGGYCAGKSSAAAALHEAGWTVIDVDALGHAALERSAPEVARLLGPGALKADGAPDRRAIGAMVFADPVLLARYEAIVHPAMNALVEEAVSRAGPRACVDAAILYRLPIVAACDTIIEARAPLALRLIRGRARDGLGALAMLGRIRSQRPLRDAGKAWKGKTVVVWNALGEDGFKRRVVGLAERAFRSLAADLGAVDREPAPGA